MVESAVRYHRSLPESQAEEYLRNRGLSGEGIEKFRLGYVADPSAGHEMYRGFLSIPYLRESPRGESSVVSIRFRCIYDHEHRGHGKYMSVSGDQSWLFNTAALLKDKRYVAITEGEIDAITAEMSGVPAVGVPGATNWREYFSGMFLGYKTVFVLADGDEAGLTFSHAVAATLPNAKVIPMPTGMDVSSFTQEHGREALKRRIR